MSVADIFKLQTGYNLHDKFNDQTNWQDAFKIANSFAETSEKHRANQENLATSDWRVDMQNALNKAKTEEQKLAFNTAQAKNQLADFYANHSYDPVNQRYHSPEELRAVLFQNPNQLNSQGTVMLDQQNREYLASMGKNLAPINPLMGSTYTAMATGSPFIADDKGNLINTQTGQTVGTISDPNYLTQFAAGDLWSGYTGALKAQQQAEKEKAVQEARLPYTLQAIQARSDAAQAKQQGWIDYRQNEALQKSADGVVQAILDESGFLSNGDKAKLLSTFNKYAAQNQPELRNIVLERLRSIGAASAGVSSPN